MTDSYQAAGYVENILSGEMQSRALIIGHRIGVFPLLADGDASVDAMAASLKVGSRVAFVKLLQVLHGIGLLEPNASDDGYALSAIARQALLPDSPSYIGALVAFFADQYRVKTTDRLQSLILDGTAVPEAPTAAEWQTYLAAMAGMASLSADKIAGLVDLAEARSLLDLGGGPASYAIAFCRAYPQLEATLYDLAPTLRVAEQNIAQAGLSDRIRCVAGSATDRDFNGRYDVIFVSHVVHLFASDTVRQMLIVARRCLRPGGRIVIREFVMNRSKSAPLLGALIGMNMWLHGAAYSFDELQHLMNETGYAGVHLVDVMDDGPAVMGGLVVGARLDPLRGSDFADEPAVPGALQRADR